MERKFLCPYCEREVGDFGGYCCGREIMTPERTKIRAETTTGCFKFIILAFTLLGLVLFVFVFAIPEFHNRREATRTVDTGLNLPLAFTNTTFITSGHSVTHYITPGGEFREVTREGVNVIDNNVRSIYVDRGRGRIFYIKNDNSLWGFGCNQRGALGTGTGVDVEEPVLIMENVASIHQASNITYALKVDKTLWRWGNGEFSPVQVAEDVVAISPQSTGYITIIQKSDGLLYTWVFSRNERNLERVRSFAMLDLTMQASINSSRSGFYINNENTLIRWSSGGNSPLITRSGRRGSITQTEITQNVQSLWGGYNGPRYNLFVIKDDYTLWGFGNNASGELGDGTRVPRENPVRIAENVISAGKFYYLTADGELWVWDSDNPTPAMALDNVATVFPQDASIWTTGFDASILLNNGVLITDYSRWSDPGNADRQERYTHTGIKIPQTIVFE